jgi:holin-like protein
MVYAFSAFLCFQAIGELITAALRVPIPGPLIGMLILLVCLLAKGGVPPTLATGADALHQHLGLFFVPIGVGLAANLEMLKAAGLALLLTILVSTWLSIAAIGIFAQAMFRRRAQRSTAKSDEAAEPVS